MLMGLLGADGLGKGHVALRQNEAERMQKMSLDEEVQEFLDRY
jgi:hypothetical protein